MVFAKSWEDFEIAAEAMLMESPEKCRYSMKYAHNKQLLVLKVTNNAKVSARFTLSQCLSNNNLKLCSSAYNTKLKLCLI